jgi:hypothetical protein
MDFKTYGRFGWKVFALAIAILSGVLSVVREAIVIISGRPPQTSLFWSWVLIAFIVSAAIVYVREYKTRVKLERLLQDRAEEDKNEKNLRLNFAGLMQDGKSLEDAIVTTQDVNVVNNDLTSRWRGWRKQVTTALEEAGWRTEAVAFSHASENPSKDGLGSYVHIPETKRLYVVQLRMERKKLEQIIERKLP